MLPGVFTRRGLEGGSREGRGGGMAGRDYSADATGRLYERIRTILNRPELQKVEQDMRAAGFDPRDTIMMVDWLDENKQRYPWFTQDGHYNASYNRH